MKRQNGDWSLVSADSTAASGPDAGACGCRLRGPACARHRRESTTRDLRGLGLFASAIRLLVGRADRAAFDERVVLCRSLSDAQPACRTVIKVPRCLDFLRIIGQPGTTSCCTAIVNISEFYVGAVRSFRQSNCLRQPQGDLRRIAFSGATTTERIHQQQRRSRSR